jgi:predicted RNA-binding protein with PUA-like domain
MAYWLLKADPADFGWSHLVRDRGTTWDGVSNNLALKHMRAVRRGDEAFIYHSGAEKAVVGVARVASDPYEDPERGDPRLVVFDLKPEGALQEPVSLAQIKSLSVFRDFPLVRMPRLSVMPVPAALWQRILRMAGDKG